MMIINRRITRLFVFVISVLLIASLAYASSVNFNSENLTSKLDNALENSVINSTGVIDRNAVLCVNLPNFEYKFLGAKGIGRADTNEEMTVDHQLFLSSVGKVVTATVIMQLYEENYFGEKGLDSTLEELGIFPTEVLDSLHMINGVSYGRGITIRQLLTHRTGLKDVDNDDENGIGEDYTQFGGYAPGSLNYHDVYNEIKGAKVALELYHNGMLKQDKLSNYYLFQPLAEWDYDAWKKDPSNKLAGQLNFFLAGANKNALFKPGEDMYYSDTNYLILGIVIEKLTGKSLDEIKYERIFKPLSMNHTYIVGTNTSSAKLRETRLSDYWGDGEPLVSLGIDIARTSRGDGGEISTLDDMNTFVQALANGKLFKNKSTLDEMIKLPDEGDFGYAKGIVFSKVDDGFMLIATGSNGAWIEYYSKYNLSIVGSINELTTGRMMSLRTSVFNALEESGIKSSVFKYGPTTINLMLAIEDNALSFLLPLILVSLLLFGITSWATFSLIKHRKSDSCNGIRKIFVWLSLITSLLNLLIVSLFVFNFSTNINQILLTGYTSSLKVLFNLLLFSLALTLIIIFLTLTSLRIKDLKPKRKFLCISITLVFIVFLIFFQCIGFLFPLIFR